MSFSIITPYLSNLFSYSFYMYTLFFLVPCWVYYYYYHYYTIVFFHLLILLRDFLVSCFYGSRRTVNVMDSPRSFTDQQLSKTKHVFFISFSIPIIMPIRLPRTSCKVDTSGNVSCRVFFIPIIFYIECRVFARTKSPRHQWKTHHRRDLLFNLILYTLSTLFTIKLIGCISMIYTIIILYLYTLLLTGSTMFIFYLKINSQYTNY